MAEKNYLKTHSAFLVQGATKKGVVITPPLIEDELTATSNGKYEAPIGKGFTTVNVNVEGGDNELFWVNLSWDSENQYYTSDATNGDILGAIENNQQVMVKYELPMVEYSGFEFASPISIITTNELAGVTIFTVNICQSDGNIMGSIYSDKTTPISSNEIWHLIFDELTTKNEFEEVVQKITITQEALGEDSFTCDTEATDIIGYLYDGTHIVESAISFARSNFGIVNTRSIEYMNDGAIIIIYYDTEESKMCKLTHLSTDGATSWTRSQL